MRLSPRALALFTPGDQDPREVREGRAREALAQHSCPAVPAFLDFLANYAGGRFRFSWNSEVEDFDFTEFSSDLSLWRHASDGPWVLNIGGQDSSPLSPAIWADGRVRMYHDGFTWSQPVATSVEKYLEHEAAVVEGLLRGYRSGWAVIADPAVAGDLAATFGVGLDRGVSDELSRCWVGPARRLCLQPGGWFTPDLKDKWALTALWDPLQFSAAEMEEILRQVDVRYRGQGERFP